MKIKIKKYKKVKSTNDIALKLIKQNVSKPTLITTEKQTNGRGRIGKKWISKKGNLFISLFFQFDQRKINFKQFAILNALLLKKVISKTISRKIKIKWPNDLMFNKMKFCGILQEVIKFDNFDYLIVGIGLNTNIDPKNKSFNSTSLKNILKKKINNQKILENIKKIYKNRGINLICIKNKWSFRTAEDLSKLMSLQKSTQKKLSKATIETLAIIVYHQPVTRSEIEEIRGVSFASNTLEILLELNWVKPAGRKDVPGKPIQYTTTENFLNHFNIQKLSDLPTIDELGSAGLIDTTSIDKSIFGTGKFFKEQSINEKQNNIYEDIDEAIKKTTEEEK